MKDSEIILEDFPSYGSIMTLDEFIKCCNDGSFIDYDGRGKYATKDKMSNKTVYPSDITGHYSDFNYGTGKFTKKICPIIIDRNFTHIVWFNR